MNKLYKTKILGVGSYVPSNLVTNSDLKQYMQTDEEWIVTRTGIQQRHWVPNGSTEGTSDLGVRAAEQALKTAGIDKSSVDMIVLATCTPDHELPGTSCFIQHKLGLSEIPCLDIRQACSGFLYALSIADSYIRLGQYKTILVIGSEVHSKALNITTEGRDVAVLFGDGAGAMVLTRAEDQEPTAIYRVDLFTQGEFAKELWIAAPGSAMPGPRITKEMIDQGLHYPYMNGKAVFMNATRRMSECLKTTVEKSGFQLSDIDIFFFHQANLRINQKVGEMLKLPESKVYNTVQKYGNTTAATIPLGMDDAYKAGVLKPGMLVGSAAFGAGFTWAASVFRF